MKNSFAGELWRRARPSRVSRSRPFLNPARVPEDQEFKWRRIPDPGKLAFDNSHGRSDGDGIEDFDNIIGSHPHTPKTACCPDRPLLRSAVDVDAAGSSVLVAWFDAFQPKYAGDDGIATSSILRDDFATEVSSLEDRSYRKIAAQFHAYAEPAKRRFIAVRSVSETEFGSGYREFLYDDAVLYQSESLLGDADHDCEGGIDGCGFQSEFERPQQGHGQHEPQ